VAHSGPGNTPGCLYQSQVDLQHLNPMSDEHLCATCCAARAHARRASNHSFWTLDSSEPAAASSAWRRLQSELHLLLTRRWAQMERTFTVKSHGDCTRPLLNQYISWGMCCRGAGPPSASTTESGASAWTAGAPIRDHHGISDPESDSPLPVYMDDHLLLYPWASRCNLVGIQPIQPRQGAEESEAGRKGARRSEKAKVPEEG